MKRPPASAVKVGIFTVATILIIGLLGTVISNTSFLDHHQYAALFTDATSVEGGETVRLAGVAVGTVTGTRIEEQGDGRLARVEFSVDKALPVYRDAEIQLRYENLVGRRYLAIVERPGGAPMAPGSTFPVSQTRPALNLTVLFNGFQPLFQALDPEQVNQLSFEIIQTLQGEAGTLHVLLANTASLTSTLADKDAVIGHLVDNLNAILTTVDDRSQGLTQLVDGFRDLMAGLADKRDILNTALPSIADLLTQTNDLVTDARAPLRHDIRGLNSLADQLADTKQTLDEQLQQLPGLLLLGNRTTDYGPWINGYTCARGAPAAGQRDDTVCGLKAPR
jgi:phospholipid/cholesterol/gamma-HCH transport system substrate-binding protein